MKATTHSKTRATVLEQIVHNAYNRRTRATRYRVGQWALLLKLVSRVITEVHAARPKGAATFSTPYKSQLCHPGTLTLLHHRRHNFWGSCDSRTSPGWKTKQTPPPLLRSAVMVHHIGARYRCASERARDMEPCPRKGSVIRPRDSHAPRKHILAPDRITASLDCAQHAGWMHV